MLAPRNRLIERPDVLLIPRRFSLLPINRKTIATKTRVEYEISFVKEESMRLTMYLSCL